MPPGRIPPNLPLTAMIRPLAIPPFLVFFFRPKWYWRHNHLHSIGPGSKLLRHGLRHLRGDYLWHRPVPRYGRALAQVPVVTKLAEGHVVRKGICVGLPQDERRAEQLLFAAAFVRGCGVPLGLACAGSCAVGVE